MNLIHFTRDAIEHTYHAIAPHIRSTPVLRGRGGEFGLPAFPLTLKLEQLQLTAALTRAETLAS